MLESLIQYSPFFPLAAAAVALIAIVWQVTSRILDNRRKLTVRQIGTNIENTATALDSGITTAIILNVLITNAQSGHRNRQFRFEVAVEDKEFDWLFDPAELVPARNTYAYSGTLEYPREMVINHRRRTEGKLNPGDTIEGLLMGKSMAQIPEDYFQGQEIEVMLVVRDTTEKRFEAPFKLRIDKRDF